MPYLRLLTNALVAGAVGAAMLAHVVLLLNPQLPLRPGVVFSIGWRVLASAGGVLTAGFFIASLLRYQSTHRSPGWLSLRLLAWMTTLVVGLGGLLAWLNLSAFEASLSADAARRFAVATGALVATAGVLLLIALVHYSFGRHGSRVGGSLYAIAVVAAVTLPLVARGVGEPVPPPVGVARAVAPSVRERPAGRVWLVLLDGASLDYVSPAAAQGRLPQLGRLLDAGASVTLFSIEPREPAPIWASVATGRYPSGSGVASSERYRAGYAHLDLLPRYVFADALRHLRLIRTEPVDRASLRGTPLWSILEASELSAGIAGWPFARHASSDHGFVLDDMPGSTRDPADADRRLRERFEDALVSHDVQLGSVRYAVLSALGRRGLGRASGIGGRRRLDAAYDFVDAEIGRLIARLAPDDLLLVVSGYRLEPASPLDRLRNRLLDDAGLAAEASRSDGFLLAFGRHVSPGRKSVGAIVDVLPTVLYYLGMPVARDMDGFARTDLFLGSLTAERPVSFIRSYQ